MKHAHFRRALGSRLRPKPCRCDLGRPCSAFGAHANILPLSTSLCARRVHWRGGFGANELLAYAFGCGFEWEATGCGELCVVCPRRVEKARACTMLGWVGGGLHHMRDVGQIGVY